jgi:hypothetical protein
MLGPDGMSIGLGIFLASLYLGTIYLYVQTRDRWNWSRLVARGAALMAGAAIGGALLYGGIVGYEKWQARARVVSAIGPISVGEPWVDVVYKLGKFKDITTPGASKYPNETVYSHETLPLTAYVVKGRVLYIVYHCRDTASGTYGPFNGIRCGADGDAVMKAFGDKVRVLCRNQADLAYLRAYDVVDYGIRYIMYSNKVSAIGVAEPAELATFSGINWDRCEASAPEVHSPEEAKKGETAAGVPVKQTPSNAKTVTGH